MSTSIHTAPPEADSALRSQQPIARHRGRRAAAATRWILVVPFVLLAPVALIAWAAIPRVSSPQQIAEEAVAIGLTEVARDAIVEEFSSELAESSETVFVAGTMREVFDRSLTQEWFDAQVVGIATEVDRWLAGTEPSLPELMIDLVPVKTALAADPAALRIVAEFVDCSGTNCTAGIAALPDEASLLSIEAGSSEAEDLIAARGLLQTTRRGVQFIPLVMLAEFALLVLLARRHARLRFAGSVALWIGGILMLVVLIVPGWVGGQAAEAVPPELPLAASEVAVLASWAIAPARTIALWMLVAGAIAVVGSYVWDVVNRRLA